MSFAEPELLILDEPTVGVDPIIRQSIWDHLVEITNTRKKTVIITTHYIEETRQAHVVSDDVVFLIEQSIERNEIEKKTKFNKSFFNSRLV